jgi:hypothetical protein
MIEKIKLPKDVEHGWYTSSHCQIMLALNRIIDHLNADEERENLESGYEVYGSQPSPTLKRTSNHWNQDDMVDIIYASGWDQNNFIHSFHEELITEEEYQRRKSLSICEPRSDTL